MVQTVDIKQNKMFSASNGESRVETHYNTITHGIVSLSQFFLFSI